MKTPRQRYYRKLSGVIQAFNRKAAKNRQDWLRTTYKDVAKTLRTTKDFKQAINRYSRYLRSGAEKELMNEFGVIYTDWERKEINYGRIAANKNREILRAKTYTGRKSDNAYEPLTVRAKDITQQRFVKNYLRMYANQGRDSYIEDINNSFRRNLMKSISWMENLDEYSFFSNLFQTGDIEMLSFLQAGEEFSTHINSNYISDEDKGTPVAYEYAKYLKHAYLLGIKEYETRRI